MIEASFVVAMTKARVIGHQGRLPWHIPEDLKRFRQLTIGHDVIMGRKTWDEIYQKLGSALPKRRNIVLTRKPLPENADAIAIAALDDMPPIQHPMIIGGAQIYQLFLPYARTIYMTRILGDYHGDTFFPKLNMAEWQEETCEQFPTHAFLTLTRR